MREARCDTTANEHDERDDCRDGEPHPVIRRSSPQNLKMKRDVRDDNQPDEQRDFQISPVLSCDDLPCDCSGEHDQIGDVNSHRRQIADLVSHQHRGATGEPQDNQSQQRPALQWHPASPVRNCGEEKSGQHSRHVTEKEFVSVPRKRAVRVCEAPGSGEQTDPQHHRDARPNCGAKKKRSKPVAQQRNRKRLEPWNAAVWSVLANVGPGHDNTPNCLDFTECGD